MGIQQPYFGRLAPDWRILRRLHCIQHRIQQIQRKHYEHRGRRVRALQLPRHSGGVRVDLFTSCLRIDSISFDILVHADVPDGIRVGIGIGKMRPVTQIGLDEHYLGIHLEPRTHRFGERIARLHGHVDSTFVVVRIGVQDDRHLRKASQRL